MIKFCCINESINQSLDNSDIFFDFLMLLKVLFRIMLVLKFNTDNFIFSR